MTAGRKALSIKKDWGTPRKYVEAVRTVFDGNIWLDPCSSPTSIVQAHTEWLLPYQDGLEGVWDFPTIYVNPPYGVDKQRRTRIYDWLKKCEEAHRLYNSQVIGLVPVATNTKHWKDFIWGKATSICFLYETRLRFLINGDEKGKGAPMSCAIVYWGDTFERFSNIFEHFGAVVDIRPLKGNEMGSLIQKEIKKRSQIGLI